jgi:tetratricopeptide (TPR) repeat protein
MKEIVGYRGLRQPAIGVAMIRSMAVAAILGGGVAVAAVYAFIRPTPQTQLAAAVEEWPICTTMGSLADSSDWAQLDPDFAAGKKAMAAGDWNAAIAALKHAALLDPQNADIQNYIGYAYRRLRQLEPAFAHYRQALAFNPRHRGAHQHMGEAYLATGRLAEAEQHLAALERICLIPCDEYSDLQTAITTYKTSATQ